MSDLELDEFEETNTLLLGRNKSSGNSCTRTVYIVLAILLVSFVAATIGLAAALIGVTVSQGADSAAQAATSNSCNSTDAQSSCTSADCVILASSMLQKMDTSVDPCVDFYNYSCGGWDAMQQFLTRRERSLGYCSRASAR